MNLSIVTGLWDIGRDKLNNTFKRDFDYYKSKCKELLMSTLHTPIIFYCDISLNEFINSVRTENIKIINKSIEDLNNNFPFKKEIELIRNNKDWYLQSSWLQESPQCKLEHYNIINMSKMFLVHDSSIINPFNTNYFIWLDCGITNTLNISYLSEDNFQNKIPYLFNKFSFISFPYNGEIEVHGFNYDKLCELSNLKSNIVSRGGLFGGSKESIKNINSIYYILLESTLKNGLMGTEESIFTIITNLYKNNLINSFQINSNGLIYEFFENLKTINTSTESNELCLYILSYNSPNQLQNLLDTFEIYDKNLLIKPKLFLLNNSTDLSTNNLYNLICKKYNIEQIKKNNIGICGGRQFIAEHFESLKKYKYYMFFEDDMFFETRIGKCENNFDYNINNILDKIISIMDKENYDFLKLSFTEFYGDNKTQWSWYNLPEEIRNNLFPNYPRNKNICPLTKFNNIKSYKDLNYIDGEIYYCNWPQIVSREGNRKMFLETKWKHPFEQTWMSYIYQEIIKNNIKSSVLLLSPINHNRFEHYNKDERREN